MWIFFGFACIMCWVMHMFDPWQRRILLEKQSGNQVTQIAEWQWPRSSPGMFRTSLEYTHTNIHNLNNIWTDSFLLKYQPVDLKWLTLSKSSYVQQLHVVEKPHVLAAWRYWCHFLGDPKFFPGIKSCQRIRRRPCAWHRSLPIA